MSFVSFKCSLLMGFLVFTSFLCPSCTEFLFDGVFVDLMWFVGGFDPTSVVLPASIPSIMLDAVE